MVLTPRPGFLRDHTEKFMSAVTQREPFFCIFLHPLSIGGFVVLLQLGIKHAPTLCIIAETKETALVVWNRRSVSWFFVAFRWGKHDKWDRLGLSLNQCWRFSFSSGFLGLGPDYPPPSPSAVQSLSSFNRFPVTFVWEIFSLMAVPQFYPNGPNLFAMCGHNQSISFERSMPYLATSYEAVIQWRGNFAFS